MRLIAMLLLFASPAFAEVKPIPLEGSIAYLGDSCGANGKAAQCRLTFEIKGATAKLLYDRMPAKAVIDTCTETLVKMDGNGMRCFKNKNDYDCDFGYSFKKRKLSLSDMSC